MSVERRVPEGREESVGKKAFPAPNGASGPRRVREPGSRQRE